MSDLWVRQQYQAPRGLGENPASQAVSAKLGYVPNGVERRSAGGVLRVDQRLRLAREVWEEHREVEVTVEGLQPCLPMFGVPDA